MIVKFFRAIFIILSVIVISTASEYVNAFSSGLFIFSLGMVIDYCESMYEYNIYGGSDGEKYAFKYILISLEMVFYIALVVISIIGLMDFLKITVVDGIKYITNIKVNVVISPGDRIKFKSMCNLIFYISLIFAGIDVYEPRPSAKKFGGTRKKFQEKYQEE